MKRSKGISFSMHQIVAILLMVAFGAILLGFFIPAAEGVENAGSCSSPWMKALASQIRDITGEAIVC